MTAIDPLDLCEHGNDMADCEECDRWCAAFFAEWARDIDLGEEDEPLP